MVPTDRRDRVVDRAMALERRGDHLGAAQHLVRHVQRAVERIDSELRTSLREAIPLGTGSFRPPGQDDVHRLAQRPVVGVRGVR